MKKNNKSGEVFTVLVVVMGLVTAFGAYKTHKGDWGAGGKEAVSTTDVLDR